jgi:hypothetical protein
MIMCYNHYRSSCNWWKLNVKSIQPASGRDILKEDRIRFFAKQDELLKVQFQQAESIRIVGDEGVDAEL